MRKFMDCIASAVLMRPRRPPNPSGPTEVRVASVRAPVADDAETAAAGRDRYDAFCREFGLLAASKENAPVFQRIDLPAWEVEEDSDEKVPFHAVVAGPGTPCLCNLIFLLRSRRPHGVPRPHSLPGPADRLHFLARRQHLCAIFRGREEHFCGQHPLAGGLEAPREERA